MSCRSFMKLSTDRFLQISLISLLLVIPLSAQKKVWKGSGSEMSKADNWEGGGLTPYANVLEMVFGKSSQYTVRNDVRDVRVLAIRFTEDAESYTISGNPMMVAQGEGQIVGVYNHSRLPQRLETSLTFFPAKVTMHSERGALLWTGGSSYTGEALTLAKTGQGILGVGGRHKGGKLLVEAGELRILPAMGFQAQTPVDVTMSGGTLMVQGGPGSAPQRINMGVFGALANRKANRVVVDANNGPGLAVNFTGWELSHEISPGIDIRSARVATLNVNLAAPKSSISMGAVQENLLANGIIPFTTVTDGEKTGFATIDNRGNLVRNTRMNPLLPIPIANVNYRVAGDFALSHNATQENLHSLTIQGAGTLSGGGDKGRLRTRNALLMEEKVGDFTIATPFMMVSSSSPIRMFQYSTDGKLIIKSSMGGDHGNYANNVVVTSGPGTIVLASDDSTLAGGFYVQEGRLELNGDLLKVNPTIDVTGGVLAGFGQVGGGIRYEWEEANGSVDKGTLYSLIRVHEGGTIDVSGDQDKVLRLHGRLAMQEGSSMQVTLRRQSTTGIQVVRNPQSVEASVELKGDLKVVLEQPPVPLSKIRLVTSNGGIDGKFATVNGQPFTGDQGNLFSVEHARRQYLFRITYDKNFVELQAGR